MNNESIKTVGPFVMGKMMVQLSETKTDWRPAMEDYSFVEEISLSKMDKNHANVCIYGVCDGHGGSDVSNFLSKNMANIVQNGLSELQSINELLNANLMKKILCNCFALLETRLEVLFPANKIKNMGSTCSMVLTIPSLNTFYAINCGDSSVSGIFYDSSNSIKVSKITRLHKPDLTDELSRINKTGGYTVNISGIARLCGSLAVSRSFGDIGHRKYGMTEIPEIYGPLKLTSNRDSPDQFIGFLIMSDGISDFTTEDEIRALLVKNFNKKYDFASILIGNTNSQDNASIISAFVK